MVARDWGLTVKGHKRAFWAMEMLYLYCDGGYMTIHLSKLIKLYLKRVTVLSINLTLIEELLNGQSSQSFLYLHHSIVRKSNT